MPECNTCGKIFDSERGLHIHQSRVHASKSEGTDQTKSTKFLEVKSIRPWIVAAVIIILGLGLIIATDEVETERKEDGLEESFSRDLKLVVEENETEDKAKEVDDYAEG
ncbi:MAG: hypothetical protein ACLFQ8_01835 [Candidatus Aenigmatarchaeota archaeon]